MQQGNALDEFGLSRREQETLRLAADGLSDRDIADRLGVTHATIRTYWERIRAKTDTSKRAHAIATVFGNTFRRAKERASDGLSALLTSDRVGVAVGNAKSEILDANDQFLRITGYTREDLEEGLLSMRALTPPEYHEADDVAQQQIWTEGMASPYSKEYVRKDGSRVHVRRAGVHLRNGEFVTYILEISSDDEPSDGNDATHRSMLL